MYVDQPLFSDVDIFLRERGFILHCFYPTVSRVVKPLIVDNNPLAELHQLLWADAIFIRDLTRPDTLSNLQLLTLAEILHDCYGTVDLVSFLLHVHDHRTGSQFGATYFNALVNGVSPA